jgi:site-specific DNA-methyltransferase (adenine-specific)
MKPYYETENGKLFCGDCLEIMPIIPDGSVDLILTDPPYGTTACNWDSVIPFDEMWKHLNRIIKKNGAIVLFGSEPFSSALRMSNIKNYRYDWVWNKDKSTNFMQIKNQPARVVENIIIFNSKKYNPQMVMADEKNKRPRNFKKENPQTVKNNNKTYGTQQRYTSESHNENLRYPKNIINIKSNEKECNNIHRVHPTQKPVALMEYLIKTYTNENEIVLDFTIGSGTTAVACEKTNRKWIGIEMLEKYCKIAKERIENEQEQLKLNL